MKLSVLGAGAWGTALALAFARQHAVTLWTRDAAHAAQMVAARCNTRYLPDCPLPANLAITADFDLAAQADLVVVVTPIAGLRPTLARLAAVGSPPVVWACKGFEAETGALPHQVAAETLPDSVPRGVLSGPSFAREVALGLPTAVVLAATDAAFAERVALALHTPHFRVYANADLVGVEVGGAVKNVMAIAAGVADGLGFGHNARAALVTRGLAEITRLAVALGGQAPTLTGLAGLGDLMLTCTGDLSRNRKVGLLLAEGRPLPAILATLGHVAEGVPTTRETLRRARLAQVDMPIAEGVYVMLFDQQSPAEVVRTLLEREPKTEHGARLRGA